MAAFLAVRLLVVVVTHLTMGARAGTSSARSSAASLSASPPDRSVVELNCRAVRRIDRSLVQFSDPDVPRPVHPASGGLAEIIHNVEVPSVLRDGGSPDTCRAVRHTSILAAQTDPIYLRRCISCDHSGRDGQCAHDDSHRFLLSSCWSTSNARCAHPALRFP